VKRTVPLARAAKASIGLSLLFLVVYGGCNWFTAHRGGAGTYYFQWEPAIPFVPLLIPAYMSIDLFFIGAPFLCASQGELRAYSRRIACAIVVAGICFLAWPFRFAFDRPNVDGIVGTLFNWFWQIDAPYNLVPSLHAALLLLVADIYLRHLRGVTKGAVILWFILIGVSPILTYQHHVIDILTGFGLAGYCFYFFPNESNAVPVRLNRRIGFYYGLGAALFTLAVFCVKGWALVMIWPAVTLAIIAAAYYGAGSGNVYRKTDGRLPWSTWFVLAPCLIGQYVSLHYYRRQCRLWDEVTPHVWIGARPSTSEARQLVRQGITAVVDLTSEFPEPRALRNVTYRNIPVLDLTAPTPEKLADMAEFIAEQSRVGTVYVHCKIGYSRSAAAVAAYLLVSGKADTAAEALTMVRRVRPSVIIRPEIVDALNDFEYTLKPLANRPRFVLASPPHAYA